jgi:hypothetical protein
MATDHRKRQEQNIGDNPTSHKLRASTTDNQSKNLGAGNLLGLKGYIFSLSLSVNFRAFS